jgi:hypothetical protein
MSVAVQSIAAQQQHYREVRARLWRAPAVIQAPEPPPVVEVVRPKLPSTIVYVRQFNQHVIAYRQWQLAQEKDSAYVPSEPRMLVEEIIRGVLTEFPDVSIGEVKGTRRQRHIVRPRQLAIYAVYLKRPDLSLPHIGRLFGGRDHTTILHAVRKMKAEFGCER